MRLIDADALRSELIKGHDLVGAKSPRDAIDQVNCDRLAYVPREEGADDEE